MFLSLYFHLAISKTINAVTHRSTQPCGVYLLGVDVVLQHHPVTLQALWQVLRSLISSTFNPACFCLRFRILSASESRGVMQLCCEVIVSQPFTAGGVILLLLLTEMLLNLGETVWNFREKWHWRRMQCSSTFTFTYVCVLPGFPSSWHHQNCNSPVIFMVNPCSVIQMCLCHVYFLKTNLAVLLNRPFKGFWHTCHTILKYLPMQTVWVNSLKWFENGPAQLSM